MYLKGTRVSLRKLINCERVLHYGLISFVGLIYVLTAHLPFCGSFGILRIS